LYAACEMVTLIFFVTLQLKDISSRFDNIDPVHNFDTMRKHLASTNKSSGPGQSGLSEAKASVPVPGVRRSSSKLKGVAIEPSMVGGWTFLCLMLQFVLLFLP
jgi:hypothetical protein